MLEIINRIVWCFTSLFIIILGLYFSFRLKGIQFKFISIIKSFFLSKDKSNSIGLLMTSLAGRVGVGSIAGICLLIYIGGVGSIFWMWISTFLCAVITYVETFLGVKYKVEKNDNYYGGPSYYIKNGLGNKKLAILYSVLIIISYIGCFLGIQSNTITKSLVDFINISPYIIGLIIVIITYFCIAGGFKKIVSVSEKIVPLMTLIYVGSAALVFFRNIEIIPSIFSDIMNEAFKFKSFFGCFLPMVLSGIQRGIFSNEAGLGTSSIVGSSSRSVDGDIQGKIQIFSIYITTLIICSCTAIILLCSDFNHIVVNDINGIELALYSFKYHFGNLGIYIMIISIIFFSFSTIITGYYYGESCFSFFFKKLEIKYVYILRILTLILLFLGCILPSSFLWGLVDVFVGIIILINLYSIWKLKDEVI